MMPRSPRSIENALQERNESIATSYRDRENLASIQAAADVLKSAYNTGAMVYAAGNGGSASQADHFVGELLGRYLLTERPPLMAVNLMCQMTSLTAIANDFKYENFLVRAAQTFRPHDSVFLFTTSGKSANIINVLDALRRREANDGVQEMPRSFLIGGLGIRSLPREILPSSCKLIVVSSSTTSVIQELTLMFIHDIIERLELQWRE